MLALSVRGPWWWFIFHLPPKQAKDIENREWSDEYAKAQFKLCPPGSNVQIHASKGMTRAEFDDACAFSLKAGATMLPNFDTLERGGIVGIVRFVRPTRSSSSKWFTGRIGLVLAAPYPLPFRPCLGALGFFDPEKMAQTNNPE